MRSRSVHAAAVVLLCPVLAFAAGAEPGPVHPEPGPLRPGPAEGRTGPREVYRLEAAIDLPVAAVSLLAIGIPNLLADQIIRKRCPCNPAEVNGLDRWAIGNDNAFADVTSDVTAVLAVVAPPLLDLADVGWSRALFQDVAVFAEALLVNGALVEVTKYAVQRPLPRTYAGEASLVGSAGGYRSFYSGHTSTVMAALATASYTLRLRHGELVWPWVVTGAVGASVAVERVAAGRHFPSDVVVGAAVGLGVGIAVPWLHARLAESRLSLVPAAAGRGLAVAGRF